MLTPLPCMPSRGILKMTTVRYVPQADPYASVDDLFEKAAEAFGMLIERYDCSSRMITAQADVMSFTDPLLFGVLVKDFKVITEIAGGRMIVHAHCFERLGLNEPVALAQTIVIQNLHTRAKGLDNVDRKTRLASLNSSSMATDCSSDERMSVVRIAADEVQELQIPSRFAVQILGVLADCSIHVKKIFYDCLQAALEWDMKVFNDDATMGEKRLKKDMESLPKNIDAFKVAAIKLHSLAGSLEDTHYGVFAMKGSSGPCFAYVKNAAACLQVAVCIEQCLASV